MKVFLFLTTLLFARASAVDWNSETIRCGNLVYGDNQTSVCFAETFLSEAASETGLKIDPKFARIALATDEVFTTPLCVFTGEGVSVLSDSIGGISAAVGRA